MNWRLEVHQVAESDIASAASWYASNNLVWKPGSSKR